jgi:hypothetical protein
LTLSPHVYNVYPRAGSKGTAHFAQFRLEQIEGSSEKVNKIKVLDKELKETVAVL